MWVTLNLAYLLSFWTGSPWGKGTAFPSCCRLIVQTQTCVHPCEIEGRHCLKRSRGKGLQLLQIPPAFGEVGFDRTEESRKISAVPLVLGRIWPTKGEVKDDPGKEVITRNYWAGQFARGTKCLEELSGKWGPPGEGRMLTQQVQLLVSMWNVEPLKTPQLECDLMGALNLCSLSSYTEGIPGLFLKEIFFRLSS